MPKLNGQIILCFSIVLLALGGLAVYYLGIPIVSADPVDTSVTVGNTAPTFSVAPFEDPASYATVPTNVGSNVTFKATGVDPSAENYYLAICKSDAITGVPGNPPTCDGGSWCISSSTASSSQSNCTYSALAGDSESQAWYAFVCDANPSASLCSASSQGSGDTGSPFKVNHAPTFASISRDTTGSPGDTITWRTNASTLDSDTDGVADTVKLVICKTAGITAGDCDGGASDRWCASSLVANNPSCSYELPVPTPSGAYNAYAYLVDSHNFPATGANQGSNQSFTVSNTAPIVSNVQINGGLDITLTEGIDSAVDVTATVTDNNSCMDISSVYAYAYRSAITYGGCDTSGEADNNYCYPEVSCSVVSSGNTCGGATDASADYECSVSFKHYADPTDTNTRYPAQNWLTSVKANDPSANDVAEITLGVELNSTVGYSVTSAINYSALDVGAGYTTLDEDTVVTATGNVGLDEELSGTDMIYSVVNSIDVGYQHYAQTSGVLYASGSSLTTSAVLSQLNCLKTTSVTQSTADTFWGIFIPVGTVPGTYVGTVEITAVKGDNPDTEW